MNILFVNTYYQGSGATLIAKSIFEKLLFKYNYIDFFYSRNFQNLNNTNHLICLSSIYQLVWRFSLKLEKKLKDKFLKISQNNFQFSWSFNIIPNFIKLPYKKYDIIHLHWIGDNFINLYSFKHFPKNIPIIWTLHDSWAFTGGCHLPFDCRNYINGCGMCPQLKVKSKNDLSRTIVQIKKKIYDNINLKIVTPSNWLAKCVKESYLLNDKEINVIHNGVDENIFKPIKKEEAKKILDFNLDRKIVLYVGPGFENKAKGLHLLLLALEILYKDFKDFELVVIGNKIKVDDDKSFKINNIGYVNQEQLNMFYNAADILVMPSLSENLPTVIIESFACKTPVVAFNIGGISDIIDDKINGCLVKPFDVSELALAIKWLITNKDLEKISENARKKFEEKFTLSKCVENYIKLYEKCLN